MARRAAKIEFRRECGNPECGAPFITGRRNKKHCSKACKNRHDYLRQREKALTSLHCPHCHKPITALLSLSKQQKEHGGQEAQGTPALELEASR